MAEDKKIAKQNIRFSQHALQRARERKLVKYVNCQTVFFDAQPLEGDKLVYEKCVYVVVPNKINNKSLMVVATMYEYEKPLFK